MSDNESSNETVLRIQVIERLDAIVLGLRAVCVLLVLILFGLMGLAAVLFTLLQ